MTNAQLKLHLGLVVPEHGRCSCLRVGNKTRPWQEGRVLFFDDSFEHEVREMKALFSGIFVFFSRHLTGVEQLLCDAGSFSSGVFAL
jgi:hypothetical protein